MSPKWTSVAWRHGTMPPLRNVARGYSTVRCNLARTRVAVKAQHLHGAAVYAITPMAAAALTV